VGHARNYEDRCAEVRRVAEALDVDIADGGRTIRFPMGKGHYPRVHYVVNAAPESREERMDRHPRPPHRVEWTTSTATTPDLTMNEAAQQWADHNNIVGDYCVHIVAQGGAG
jgi:hypothetical protein